MCQIIISEPSWWCSSLVSGKWDLRHICQDTACTDISALAAFKPWRSFLHLFSRAPTCQNVHSQCHERIPWTPQLPTFTLSFTKLFLASLKGPLPVWPANPNTRHVSRISETIKEWLWFSNRDRKKTDPISFFWVPFSCVRCFFSRTSPTGFSNQRLWCPPSFLESSQLSHLKTPVVESSKLPRSFVGGPNHGMNSPVMRWDPFGKSQ